MGLHPLRDFAKFAVKGVKQDVRAAQWAHHQITRDVPNIVPPSIRRTGFYQAVLSNNRKANGINGPEGGGLGVALHGLTDPLTAFLQHPSRKNALPALAMVMPGPKGRFQRGGETILSHGQGDARQVTLPVKMPPDQVGALYSNPQYMARFSRWFNSLPIEQQRAVEQYSVPGGGLNYDRVRYKQIKNDYGLTADMMLRLSQLATTDVAVGRAPALPQGTVALRGVNRDYKTLNQDRHVVFPTGMMHSATLDPQAKVDSRMLADYTTLYQILQPQGALLAPNPSGKKLGEYGALMKTRSGTPTKYHGSGLSTFANEAELLMRSGGIYKLLHEVKGVGGRHDPGRPTVRVVKPLLSPRQLTPRELRNTVAAQRDMASLQSLAPYKKEWGPQEAGALPGGPPGGPMLYPPHSPVPPGLQGGKYKTAVLEYMTSSKQSPLFKTELLAAKKYAAIGGYDVGSSGYYNYLYGWFGLGK